MTDIVTSIKSGITVRNGSTVMGVTEVGRYNTIQQGVNQQVPFSGESMTITSGDFIQNDNGPYAQRFKDPQATKVRFY